MSLPNETSTYCKNYEDCGVYNIPEGYCIDCAIKKLLEAGVRKKTIKKVIKVLYGEEAYQNSYQIKNLK